MEDRQWCKECYEQDGMLIEVELVSDYIRDVNTYKCEVCGNVMVWNRSEYEWEHDKSNDCGIGFMVEGE